MYRILILALCSLLLAGCATGQNKPFKLKNLAKSEIDMVTDAHISEVTLLSRQLLIKLYKRNPNQLRKAPAGTTIETRLRQLFIAPYQTHFAELNNSTGINAIALTFDPHFKGDRVFALMAGMTGMLRTAYNNQDEFFMLDELDSQKLYNSARNLEAIAWQLNTRKQKNGAPWLLTNGFSKQGVPNLSFERNFGKMIALQDMLASLIADASNRTITKVVQGVASTTLIPI